MTVRARITLLATLVVGVVLAVAGIGLVAQQRRLLTQAVDESIQQRADEVMQLDPVPARITGLTEDDMVVQVVVDGGVVGASTTAPPRPLGTTPPAGHETITTTRGLGNDPARYRLLSRASKDGRRIVHVAGTLDDADASIDALARSLAIAVPAVTALLGALVWWTVGRTLRPVEAIRAEVASIGGADLDRRVPVPDGDDEVARLARTMNDMLGRLDDAAVRQQRFVADASHELRSPLTRMRTELEVDLAHPDRADLAATHASVLEEVVGLQRLTDDLLIVARSDAAVAPGPSEPVDLDDVALHIVRQARAGDHGLAIDTTAISAARVHADPDELGRAVRNLVDNAIRHARSAVAVEVAVDGPDAVLRVADDGPGIPAEERDRVFERFARLDDSRRAGDGGAGLGLAIARAAAERAGGSLVVDSEPHRLGGACVVLRLPADHP